MFEERMEILEYRQKIEVELTINTFPDTTITVKRRENWFLARVCVCLSDSAEKLVSGILRTS